MAIALPVAGFHLLHLQTLEQIPERLANQGRSVDASPPGGTVGSVEQVRIENNLDRFHSVEYTPQENPQSSSGSYFSTCTSTLSTAGRSRTMGAQESPASAEAYTCPPVVPK